MKSARASWGYDDFELSLKPGKANIAEKIQDKFYPKLLTNYKKKGMVKSSELIDNEKAIRRVLNPYISSFDKKTNGSKTGYTHRTSNVQHIQQVSLKKETLEFTANYFFQSNKNKEIASKDVTNLLHESADILRDLTKSSGVVLYSVDEELGTLTMSQKYISKYGPRKVTRNINDSKTISACVANNKESIMTGNINQDERFPEGVGWIGPTVKSVLCVPVITPDDNVLAIIELVNDRYSAYHLVDLQISISLAGWIGATLHQSYISHIFEKKILRNNLLLEITSSYFANTITIQEFVSEFVNQAKEALSAEHGSFYILQKENDEFLAECYVEGADWKYPLLQKKKLLVRFDPFKDIIGIVARTGDTMNIKDAATDDRCTGLKRNENTEYTLKTLLCVPIILDNVLLGIIQLENKRDGSYFDEKDEMQLQSFRKYCYHALNYKRLCSNSRKCGILNDIYRDMLSIYMGPSKTEIAVYIENLILPKLPANFYEFDWYITPEEKDLMPQYVHYMLLDAVGRFFPDINKLAYFLLSTKKSYRNNPYHNYEHAFNVAHSMYVMLRKNVDKFSELEVLSLLIAAHCHDLNHPGLTNNFLQITKHSLVQLYDESPLENHHVHVTLMILQDSGLFDGFDLTDYNLIKNQLYDIIIASDLAVYFRCRAKLLQVVSEGFDWHNVSHRTLLKSIMMTSADLSGQSKPFKVNKKITETIYREFYMQGDREKKMGLNPLSLMDRTKPHMIFEDQINFINFICMPCSELLMRILPSTAGMLKALYDLRSCWGDLLEMKRRKRMKDEALETEIKATIE